MSEQTSDADGYPSDDTIRRIKQWPFNDPRGLLDFVCEAWHWGDSMFTWKGRKLSISTGGWSGNESLIWAMMKNPVFWAACWMSSRRGGHYEFYVPKAFIKSSKL